VQVQNGGQSYGAGVIWDSDGVIVTNAHVVRRRRPEVILADGRHFDGALLAHDPELDLAALRIPAGDLPAIRRGDSRALPGGTWVLAIGHPWGVRGAVSAGTVIDVGVPVEMPLGGREYVQVGLQVRPGHSGGPLVDGNRRLVGINTMLNGPQVGLAIPVHVVEQFMAALHTP